MAEAKIDITAYDYATQVFKKVEGGLNSITGSVSGFAKKAIASYTDVRFAISDLISVSQQLVSVTGQVYGTFISIGMQMEDYSTKLEVMTGSQEKAAQTMDYLKKVAETVPDTFQDVVEAATTIKAYGGEINTWTKPLADVAAYMKVTLPEAADAFGRAFSAGAGAADIFRQKGILELIKTKTGIEDLTKISLPEFRQAMYDTFTDGSVGISGMSNKLSKNLRGALSMVQDAWDKFRATVAEYVMPVIKNAVDQLLKQLDKWSKDGTLIKWAEVVGEALVTAWNWAIEYLGKFLVRLAEGASLFYTFKSAAANVFAFILTGVDMIATAFRFFWDVVAGDGERAWDTLMGTTNTVFENQIVNLEKASLEADDAAEQMALSAVKIETKYAGVAKALTIAFDTIKDKLKETQKATEPLEEKPYEKTGKEKVDKKGQANTLADLKEWLTKVRAAWKAHTTELQKDEKQALNELNKLWKEHIKYSEEVTKQRTAYGDSRRELLRKGMTDEQKWHDKWKEFRELEALASRQSGDVAIETYMKMQKLRVDLIEDEKKFGFGSIKDQKFIDERAINEAVADSDKLQKKIEAIQNAKLDEQGDAINAMANYLDIASAAAATAEQKMADINKQVDTLNEELKKAKRLDLSTDDAKAKVLELQDLIDKVLPPSGVKRVVQLDVAGNAVAPATNAPAVPGGGAVPEGAAQPGVLRNTGIVVENIEIKVETNDPKALAQEIEKELARRWSTQRGSLYRVQATQ